MKRKSLWIFLTNECNLKCTYCHQNRDGVERMSPFTGKKSVDWLFSEFKNEKFDEAHLSLYGGEPLLNFSTLKEIVRYSFEKFNSINKKSYYQILTNGTLINDNVLKFCKKYNIKIQLSIDGKEKTQDLYRRTKLGEGSYQIIQKNNVLNKFIEYNYYKNVSANMVFTPATVGCLCENLFFLMEKGFKEIQISPTLESNWLWNRKSIFKLQAESNKIYDLIFSEILSEKNSGIWIEPLMSLMLGSYMFKYYPSRVHNDKFLCKTKCGAGRDQFTIDPLGNIYSCPRLIDEATTKEFKSKFCLGNIHVGVWNKEALNLFKNVLPRKNQNCRCSLCKWTSFCPYQCLGLFYNTNKNFLIPNSNACILTKAIGKISEKFFDKLIHNRKESTIKFFEKFGHSRGIL